LVDSGRLAFDGAYTQAADEQKARLEEIGIDPNVVRLSSLSGHASLEYFIGAGAPSLEEWILHIADDLCHGDTVVMLSERIVTLKEDYPWMTESGRDVLNGETYIEAQERIAREILDELAGKLGFETGEALNWWLVEKFRVVV
jgi:hypothetical protein